MLRRMLSLLLFVAAPALAEEITVYKSPTCGCCKAWVKHLQANGFTVVAKDVRDVAPYKETYGVPPRLGACHTARVDGYTVEGHVPAADIRRLLQERPPVRGLAVPGMPPGSPGMESRSPVRYETLTFDADGRIAVYARH